MSDDDWGDMDEPTGPARTPRSHRRRTGPSQSQRFMMTLAVTAVVMLALGVLIGVAIGRATAPRTAVTPPATTKVTTPSVEPTEPAETSTEPTTSPEPSETVPPEPAYTPPAPKQLSPADGARIAASKVALKWSKITPPNAETVTYSFDIETYAGGKWTDLQTITGLTAPTYSARVLANNRRWRVWAVVDDVAGPKSGWRTYRHTPVAAPKPSTPSTTTSPTP